MPGVEDKTRQRATSGCGRPSLASLIHRTQLYRPSPTKLHAEAAESTSPNLAYLPVWGPNALDVEDSRPGTARHPHFIKANRIKQLGPAAELQTGQRSLGYLSTSVVYFCVSFVSSPAAEYP